MKPFKLDTAVMYGPHQFILGEQTWLVVNCETGELDPTYALEGWVQEARKKGWLE
jgi:hypothetical protein